MALNIIFGNKDLERITKELGLKFIRFVGDMSFDALVRENNYEVLKSDFAARVMKDIDRVDSMVVPGVLYKNSGIGIIPSQLSQGSKFLIAAYMQPKMVYMATMGDNCIPFLEELASKKDIYINVHRRLIPDFKLIDHVVIWNYSLNGTLPFVVHSREEYIKVLNVFHDEVYTDAPLFEEEDYEDTEEFEEYIEQLVTEFKAHGVGVKED